MTHFRDDFPIFKQLPELVYLDSAATSQKPQIVLDAITSFYTTTNASIYGGLHPLAEKATQQVEEVREKVATFINAASADEIIFTKNATEGVNLIAATWGEAQIKKSDMITTTVMEHHANFVPWQHLAEEKGAQFKVLDIHDDGTLDIPGALLKSSYRASPAEFTLQNTKLLAVTLVSNVLGTINPVENIIKHARRKNPKLTVCVDASQAAPHLSLDVQKLDCDFLVFSGHKLLAETGIGILYMKKKHAEHLTPYQRGSSMVKEVSIEKTTYQPSPARFEAGTLHLSGIISLGAAIDYLKQVGFEALQTHEREVTEYCLKQLRQIKTVTLLGPHESEKRSGIIAFTMDNVHSHDIAQLLGERQICVSAGHHCAQPLHTRLKESATTRISLALYNTKEDIDTLCQALKAIQKRFS